MRSTLCSMSLSVVVQKERDTYRRRRDILRRVRFLFQTFSRNDLPGEAPLSRGRSVFKKRKKEKNNGSEVFPDGLVSCLETFRFLRVHTLFGKDRQQLISREASQAARQDALV